MRIPKGWAPVLAKEIIGELLKKYYPIVVNTGLMQNTRPPNEGKWRAYYTVIKRSDDDE